MLKIALYSILAAAAFFAFGGDNAWGHKPVNIPIADLIQTNVDSLRGWIGKPQEITRDESPLGEQNLSPDTAIYGPLVEQRFYKVRVDFSFISRGWHPDIGFQIAHVNVDSLPFAGDLPQNCFGHWSMGPQRVEDGCDFAVSFGSTWSSDQIIGFPVRRQTLDDQVYEFYFERWVVPSPSVHPYLMVHGVYFLDRYAKSHRHVERDDPNYKSHGRRHNTFDPEAHVYRSPYAKLGADNGVTGLSRSASYRVYHQPIPLDGSPWIEITSSDTEDEVSYTFADLHYCPVPDPADSTGGAPKANSIHPTTWGQIKSLFQP